MEIAFWLALAAALVCALIALDSRHWYNKIESDLKDYLGDVQVARDAAPGGLRVHFDAQVAALKSIIRKHFDL